MEILFWSLITNVCCKNEFDSRMCLHLHWVRKVLLKLYWSIIDQLGRFICCVDSTFGFRHLARRQGLDLFKENMKKGWQKLELIQVNLPTAVQSHANVHFKSHSFVSWIQHVGPQVGILHDSHTLKCSPKQLNVLCLMSIWKWSRWYETCSCNQLMNLLPDPEATRGFGCNHGHDEFS